MAGLLFIYTRTSIRAAKRNAQQHREADGGQISWYNETQRRHGRLEAPGAQQSPVTELGKMVGEQIRGLKAPAATKESHGKSDVEKEVIRKIREERNRER